MNRLTLVPEGGLCNRIYAVASAINLAKKHNIRLTVIWFKDWGMGADFYDLFTLPSNLENVEVKEASFFDFFKFAKPIKSNFFLPKIYQKLKFDTAYFWYKEQFSVEEWYLSHPDSCAFYLFHCKNFYDNTDFQHLLSPVDFIQKRINERVKLISSHTIGIHIRRTDSKAANINSPLSAFIKKMQQEIDANSEIDFYVASDSLEEKKNLTDIFGNRIISVENNLKRNTKDGIIDALVELHTLASTKKIYGSFYSTYSLLASEINKIPIEIVYYSAL